MAFTNRAVIDWPGYNSPDKTFVRFDALDFYHKAEVKLLVEYSLGIQKKLKTGDRTPFKFSRETLRFYIQGNVNPICRQELRSVVQILENFDYKDTIKRTNLLRLTYFLTKEREGLAYFALISKTQCSIDLKSILKEMNTEDFELFEESRMFNELKTFGRGLINTFPKEKIGNSAEEYIY